MHGCIFSPGAEVCMSFLCEFELETTVRWNFETEYKGVHFYFVDNEFYFAGPSPYNNIYEDVEKFAYFSKAVLESLPYLDFAPNIIHCHDWQTGLVPVYLRTTYGDDNFYAGIKTIYSIHNMKFQGRWRIQEVMDITGLPKQIFNASELESYGEANYLKGGIVYADAVSTVSPTYAKEITTVEGGEGLDGLMSARRDSLYGILNGIDYEEYNPKIDPYIDTNFSRKDVFTGKKKNKAALQKELGLPQREDTFLVGIVSRMTNQKGFDLIAYVLDELLSTVDIQLVVLGTGESQYENMFHHFQNKYPDKISSYIGYSEERAHKIYASADAFLMPSLFEPCGLSQMMSMRYGTIPIVRRPEDLRIRWMRTMNTKIQEPDFRLATTMRMKCFLLSVMQRMSLQIIRQHGRIWFAEPWMKIFHGMLQQDSMRHCTTKLVIIKLGL